MRMNAGMVAKARILGEVREEWTQWGERQERENVLALTVGDWLIADEKDSSRVFVCETAKSRT